MRSYREKRSTILSALVALAVVVLFSLSATALRAAEILNQATAQYIVPTSGDTLDIASSTVRVSVTAEGMTLSKSASNLAPNRNDEVTFTLQAKNSFYTAAAATAISVNGNPQNAFVIRDAIPANTTFSQFVNADGGQPLYHLIGQGQHAYLTAAPADLAQVDAIAFAFTTFDPGTTYTVKFAVKINGNAAGPVQNIARIYFTDTGTEKILDSNPVTLNVPPGTPLIHFYKNSSFTNFAVVTKLGWPLYIQADAAECNLDPAVAETHQIRVTSKLTGDMENYEAVETAPNSGVFRVNRRVPTQESLTSVPGDGIIQSVRNDSLTATIEGCGAASTQSVILIDPDGVVFDSRSDAPIPGATVTIINQSTGTPATVYQADGVTPAPSTVTTDAAGHYQFPVVDPGVYRLKVVPPVGYKVPSKVPPAQLPPGRSIDPEGSYLGSFSVTLLGGNVHLDVPADYMGQGLLVDKVASRTEAEFGEFVEYQVKVLNASGVALSNVRLVDTLPAGFFYEKGSAKLDGTSIPDPVFKASSQFEIILPILANNAFTVLTYRVKIGPGAAQGDGVNSAQAIAPGPPVRKSNVATAKVKLIAGVFTDKSVVIGKVFVDANQNRVQDEGELGIPGVRLYTEDGTYVITDSEGKYSIYGLTPRTHVLKLDPTTMPRGSQLEVLNTRNADYPGTLFLDLKRYEMHKANFAEGSGSKEVLDEVKRRREKGEVAAPEIDRTLKQDLTPDGLITPPSDPKGLPAMGVVGDASLKGTDPVTNKTTTTIEKTNAAPNFTPLLPENMLNNRNSQLPNAPIDPLPYARLENSITNVDNKLGFLDLKDKDTLPVAQTMIRVKGNVGGKIVLKVNGVEVPKSQMGKRIEVAAKQIQAMEFIGVNLKPGENTLDLSLTDSFGNVRGKETIHVIAPDKLATIKLVLPKQEQPADGNTPAKITVLLQDAKGVPVTARTPLTIETSAGRWNVEDLDKREPGVQVFIEGGKAEFQLLAPDVPMDADIRVSSGILQDRAKLPFLPDLRPMLAVGVVEGTLNLSKLNASMLVPTRSNDGFEEELRNLSVSSDDGKLNAAARTAFFLKGKLKGEYLLTAGFDSAKQKERLFRDIQPDEFYPVYGDSSIRGYDAQSSGKLYVRIDKKRCYVLYGDFITSSATEVRGLGNYTRSLSGVREHYEKDKITANIWASQDSTKQVIEELPANGTSGPFFFGIHDAVAGSETIEILTRDRNQPSVILRVQHMDRFTDYEFEPFTGRILFRAPIPSLDRELNPISIRATFEVDQGGDKFWVYGADAQVKINDHWEVGGAAVHDDNPTLRYDLRSVNTTVKLTQKTYAIAEVAQSDNELTGVGNAGRVEIRHQDAKTDGRVYVGKTEANFTNNASIMQPNRVEGGFKVTQKLQPSVSLVTEGIWTEEGTQSGSRKGVTADLIKSWGLYSLGVGARHSQETTEPANNSTVGITPNEVNSLRAKFSMPVPKLPTASVYAEYENDVKETDNRMFALGADWRIHSKTKFYARHEFISSLGGPFELNNSQQQNTTVVGLETEYMKNGTLFNEYRGRDSFSGRETEASTGLRNLWNVAEGVRLNTTLERITPIVNGREHEATAVTGGIEYTKNPDSKTTARLELRSATENDTLLNTLGYARKMSRDWTFLTRTILLIQANKAANTGDKQQGRFQAGMAYRQTETDKWNALFKYEYKYENDETNPKSALERQANIFMTDVNYQATADLVFNLHYATKIAFETSPRYDDTTMGHLVGARVTYDLTKRWDIGFNANTLFDGGFAHQQFAIGPEVGFIVKKNLRIAVGYNVTGFRDRDLDDGYTDQGVFVNIRMKFDETLFKRKEEKE